MGAGHCQWGELTDQNVCNIYGQEHLASRYSLFTNDMQRFSGNIFATGCRRKMYRKPLHIISELTVGPLAAAAERVTHGRKARKYIRISSLTVIYLIRVYR